MIDSILAEAGNGNNQYEKDHARKAKASDADVEAAWQKTVKAAAAGPFKSAGEAVDFSAQMMPFESQSGQFPKKGTPGLSYQKEEVSPGKAVDIILHRDDKGAVTGILYHYPQDIPPYEKKGNINVFVDPKARRQGIATKLMDEAHKHFEVKLMSQTYTTRGAAFANKYVKRIMDSVNEKPDLSAKMVAAGTESYTGKTYAEQQLGTEAFLDKSGKIWTTPSSDGGPHRVTHSQFLEKLTGATGIHAATEEEGNDRPMLKLMQEHGLVRLAQSFEDDSSIGVQVPKSMRLTPAQQDALMAIEHVSGQEIVWDRGSTQDDRNGRGLEKLLRLTESTPGGTMDITLRAEPPLVLPTLTEAVTSHSHDDVTSMNEHRSGLRGQPPMPRLSEDPEQAKQGHTEGQAQRYKEHMSDEHGYSSKDVAARFGDDVDALHDEHESAHEKAKPPIKFKKADEVKTESLEVASLIETPDGFRRTILTEAKQCWGHPCASFDGAEGNALKIMHKQMNEPSAIRNVMGGGDANRLINHLTGAHHMSQADAHDKGSHIDTLHKEHARRHA